MDAKEFDPTAKPVCPNPQCEEVLEDTAQDYVPPHGIYGEEHTCPECDCRFMAARQKDGKIRFELIEEDDEDNET